MSQKDDVRCTGCCTSSVKTDSVKTHYIHFMLLVWEDTRNQIVACDMHTNALSCCLECNTLHHSPPT